VPAATSVPPAEVLALLERIQCARDLREAVAVLFERVLLPHGVERAVAVARVGTEVRGVMGLGVDAADVRRFSVSVATDLHPAVRALATGTRTPGEADEGRLARCRTRC
jgi:hypothetical protein